MEIKNWKNCPVCGGKLDFSYFQRCTKCQREFYNNPSPAVGVLIWNKRGQLLLSQRDRNPAKGKFDFPGGFVDANDTIEKTLEKEIKEELKIKISNFKYLISLPNVYEYKKVIYNTLDLYFEVELTDELIAKIKPSDDVQSIKFFDLAEIKNDSLAFEVVQQVIELVKKRDK
jgi:NADH pyrophosphatase NudC (nudix superfamily)